MPLDMELREVQMPRRLIIGVVAPYNETSYLVPDPSGERICRGAFNRSIHHQHAAHGHFRGSGDAVGRKIRLVLGHKREPAAIGLSESWRDDADGLTGVFRIRDGAEGDQVLANAEGGYYGGLSVEFVPVAGGRVRNADDGVWEVREAKLLQVALVDVPAYESALLTGAMREAQQIVESIAPRPTPDLSPIPRVWDYASIRH